MRVHSEIPSISPPVRSPLYNGGGAREAFCCSVDFCTDPDPPGADGASSFVYDPVGGGGGAVNSLEEQKGQFMAGQQLNRLEKIKTPNRYGRI